MMQDLLKANPTIFFLFSFFYSYRGMSRGLETALVYGNGLITHCALARLTVIRNIGP